MWPHKVEIKTFSREVNSRKINMIAEFLDLVQK